MKTTLFSELGLSAELLKAIDKLGFEQASPIQAEAIPVLLRGCDVVGQSQTGSGKTAAFAAPAIEKVDPHSRAVQVLVLCPTRELAVQVSEEVHKLALFKRGIHALPIYGGQSYERQFYGLKQGAQIVIGTPGRLMDHMQRGTLRLDTIKMVILDEADVMLDMGFRDDIEFILQKVPPERQTVFFSATMPRAIQELIQKYSRDPQSVRIEQKTRTVPTVEQVYYEVDRRFKIELLTRLIDIHDLKLGIIFCNTKAMVDDLVDHLEAQGYSADRLHGGMTQAMRDRVMNRFRRSGLEFLVATDVAARGIDVDDVQVVFNYDLPYDPEDYLHRIGRTGRAGRSGQAISFVSGRELFQIQQIERFTRVRIQRGRPPTRNEAEEARANVFLDKLRATLQSGEYQRQDHLIERLLEEGFSSTDIASAMLHYLQGGEAPPATKPAAKPAAFEGEAALNRTAPAEKRVTPVERPVVAPQIDPPTRPSPVTPAKAAGVPAPVPAPAGAIPAPAPRTLVRPAPAVVRAKPVVPPGPQVRRTPAAIPSAKRTPVALPRLAAAAPIPPPPAPGVPKTDSAVAPPKASRRTPGEQTRLFMNIGAEMGVTTGDVVGAILGETGLPPQVVGVVDVRERHLFVDVASEHANSIIAKLGRTQIRGRRVKIKVA